MQAVGEDDGDIADPDTDTYWKQYPSERALQEYELRRTVLNERKGIVPYFEMYVTILAIVQVSSAAVERVFSQLTFI